MPYHLVLVHGTGARGAPWTREPTSSLCAHLKTALGEPPSFSHSDWSGRNTHLARADGGRALIEHLRHEAPADRPLVLVGHSHGGSVIAQALVQDADLCQRVAGVVFLSTPFLHARLLPLSKHLPKGPAFLAGAVCAMAVVVGIIAALATATDWPEDPNPWLSGVALVGVFAGLFTWAVVFDRVGQWLGAGDGRLTDGETRAVARLVEQMDLGVLDQRGISSRSLLLRSTGDEAAGGLAVAQVLGRIASDVPALAWKMPAWLGRKLLAVTGFKGDEPPRWFISAFIAGVLAWFVGGCVVLAAWLLPDWGPIHAADRARREIADRVIGAGVQVWVWAVNVVVLVLLTSVPLMVLGAPFKLLSLFAYGLRGWPVLRAMFVELSVEPAPPGSWRLHQLEANGFEPAAAPSSGPEETPVPARGETALVHSYVYDDARAHRVIAGWLSSGCGTDTPPRRAARTP